MVATCHAGRDGAVSDDEGAESEAGRSETGGRAGAVFRQPSNESVRPERERTAEIPLTVRQVLGPAHVQGRTRSRQLSAGETHHGRNENCKAVSRRHTSGLFWVLKHRAK